jgi:hypothetical protein
MTTHSDVTARRERKAHGFAPGEFLYRLGKPLFVGLIFFLMFLLGTTMVQHRFFRGGHYDRNGKITQ